MNYSLLSEANNVLEIFTQPIYIIVYIVLVVLIIVAVIISVMVNEHRFNKVSQRLVMDAEQLENEQQKIKSGAAARSGCRFDMLKAIDEAEKTPHVTNFVTSCTLSSICDEFRLFAANRLGLYYDISDIRAFIAGLAVSHIVILQGMSGTGKTSLAFAFGEFLNNPSVIVPVQPMWKERTDLLGHYNEFTKRFNETLLLEKMYEANGRKDMYIVILDELNIARVEYYFAEFLSLLEIPNLESRYLEVVSDKWDDDPVKLKDGRIKLPENMWFVGTANNDDSTFAISDKVYDRAMVLDLDRKSIPFQTSSSRKMPISADMFNELARRAMESYTISQDSLYKLEALDAYLIEKFQLTFGNRIMVQILKYIPIYVACGGTELAALDDILSKKVMRKLESQNTAYIRSEAEELCAKLDSLFGVDAMPRCKARVRRIARSI